MTRGFKNRDRKESGRLPAALGTLALLVGMLHGQGDRILSVRDFGAIPGDGKSDLAAIAAALEAAKSKGARVLAFEAGTYLLDGEGTDLGKKQALLYLAGMKDLELRGSAAGDGRPATRLERRWVPANDFSPPSVLYIDRCTNITVKNLELGNDPPVSTMARVVAVDRSADEVTVEMLPRMPAFDGMRSASAQLWNLSNGELKRMGATPKEASLNWGLNPKQYWKALPERGGATYLAKGYGYAGKTAPGDGISWFFDNSQKNNQTWIMYSRDVTFENVNYRNVATMGLLAGYNHNLTMRRVRFTPENGNLAVGSRDGMHFSMTSGRLLVEDCAFYGLRMDPLVIRKTFGIVESLLGAREMRIKPAFPCPDGSRIRFWVGESPQDCRISSSRQVPDGGTVFTFQDAPPAGTQKGSAVTFQAYALDSAIIRRCTFEENLGSPVVNFEENLVMEDCLFRHNSYQVKFGANEVTGAFARNTVVRNNVFCDAGWVDIAGRESPSCLTIHSLCNYFESPRYNQGLTISNNIFSNNPGVAKAVAVHVLNAEDVLVSGNRFVGFEEPVRVDGSTTRDIRVEGNVHSR